MPLPEPNRLIPLRKFAKPGVYSAAYLSQLVQRKRLKAQRIGRNFYTTQAWFDEYLALHARDHKQDGYAAKRPSSRFYAGAIVALVFLFVLGSIWYFDHGRVAGESEVATTTVLNYESRIMNYE
jgi:hypothetical protein